LVSRFSCEGAGRARSLTLGVRPPAKSYCDPFTAWSLTMTNRLFKRARAFARHLNRLRDRRRSSREAHLPVRRQRQSLTPRQRAAVLAKTGGRCHICGGKIRRASLWHADHILAHAHGGPHNTDNYLPAHSAGNGPHRAFTPEEFHGIIKPWVWMKTRITKKECVGRA